MKKSKKKKKANKKALKKVIIGYVVLVALVLTTTIISGDLEIFLFFLFFSFLLFFMSAGVFMFIQKTSYLTKYNGWVGKITFDNNNIIESPKTTFYNSPITFHVFLILLVLLSLIFSTEGKTSLNEDYYSWFMEDMIFQIVSSVLFVILGILNPFLQLPEELKERIKEKKEKRYNFITNTQKFFWFRTTLCLIAIAWFVYKEWLVFPAFPEEHLLILGIDIALLSYVFRNLYLMVKYPRSFFSENIFRVLKSQVIVFASAFILIPLVPMTMLTIHILGINEQEFNHQPLFFIAFNLIIIYLEYTLYKGMAEKTVSKELVFEDKK